MRPADSPEFNPLDNRAGKGDSVGEYPEGFVDVVFDPAEVASITDVIRTAHQKFQEALTVCLNACEMGDDFIRRHNPDFNFDAPPEEVTELSDLLMSLPGQDELQLLIDKSNRRFSKQ